MKRLTHILLTAAVAVSALAAGPASAQVTVQSGDLIKAASNPSVYYFGEDGRRYVFPNDKAYFTWYSGFSTVKTIDLSQLSSIPLGGNVTYKPASKMVKIVSDPKVYAISKNGILRPIASEAVASALYGADWNRKIDDIPDAFFVNYRVGAAVASAADFDKSSLAAGVPSINVDRLLTPPPAGFIDYRQTLAFTPGSTTVHAGGSVTWIVLDASAPHVASNPHPIHTDVPGLESTNLGEGATYTFTFTKAGTWGYHNHNFPSQGGLVVVN